MKQIKRKNSGKTPDRALKEPFLFRKWLRGNWISLVVLAVAAVVFSVLLVTANQGVTSKSELTDGTYLEEAEVINVSRDTVSPDRYKLEENELGTQLLLVRIKTGLFAGETVEVKNNIEVFSGTQLKTGDRIILGLSVVDGAINNTGVYQYDRGVTIWLLLGLFVLITIVVGGKKGVKSLLGLALTVVMLIWIYCPLMMKGASPFWTAFLLCAFIEIVCFTILDGIRRKTVCAMLGTAAGVLLAVLFGLLAQKLMRIDSYSMYDSDSRVAALFNLQGILPVHIHGLLSAGIVISSLGAVMDVAMSLSSAIQELKTVNAELTRGKLWRSAMRIGRDMVGTMTNTLILAFAGSSLVLILDLWSRGLSYRELFSSRFLAVELTSALSCSIGVILAVPLTALIGAFFFGGRKKS